MASSGKAYDPNAKCPKCGHCEVSSMFTHMGGEHIKRTCKRCLYDWREDCLDGSTPGGYGSANYKPRKGTCIKRCEQHADTPLNFEIFCSSRQCQYVE